MRLVTLVGNPRPASRTLGLAEIFAGEIASRLPAPVEHRLIDLALYGSRLFDSDDVELQRVCAEVAAADMLICASPVYKASYTGLLKAFLDRFPTAGLAGVVGVPVMTGGTLAHAMAIETALRPLLVECGAIVPVRGLFLLTEQTVEHSGQMAGWIAANIKWLKTSSTEI
jgi:FMN reductase